MRGPWGQRLRTLDSMGTKHKCGEALPCIWPLIPHGKIYGLWSGRDLGWTADEKSEKNGGRWCRGEKHGWAHQMESEWMVVVVERLGQVIKITSVSRTQYKCLVDVFYSSQCWIFCIKNKNCERQCQTVTFHYRTKHKTNKKKTESCKNKRGWISDSFLSDIFPVFIFSFTFVQIRSWDIWQFITVLTHLLIHLPANCNITTSHSFWALLPLAILLRTMSIRM